MADKVIPNLEKNSFVISINKERYEFFKKVWNHYNITIPNLFHGCKHTNGKIGCLLSHYCLLKMALALKLEYIIVYEDDVLPRKDFVKYYNEAIQNVPDDWVFLKLEDVKYKLFQNRIDINDYWFTGINQYKGSGTGFYIIKKNIIPFIIAHIEKYELNPRIPIDYIYQFIIKKGFYISNKLLCLQHNLHNQKTIHTTGMFTNRYLVDYTEDIENFEPEIFKQS